MTLDESLSSREKIYVKGLVKLGDSANSKFVLLPPDLLESVKQIFKK